MTRNTFSDMTPRKRSIRDIPLPHKGKTSSTKVVDTFEPRQPERIQVQDGYFASLQEQKDKPSKTKRRLAIALIVMVMIGWGASVFFHSAKVIIVPVTHEYKGVIDIAARTDAAPTELQYDRLQFKETVTTTVPATNEEQVSIKATGKIMIYNVYSTTAQKLIANTRFESASGKIYRIQNAVTVPGYTTVQGEKKPGSVEATIVADVAGEAYNSTKTDFTIPGFKGTPQYKTFYARSTTDIEGGFVGMQKKVDDAVLAEKLETLKQDLGDKMQASIVSKIPADFIYIEGASTINYSTPKIGADGDNATIELQADIQAYVFKKEGINEALRRATPDVTATQVIVHDYSTLSINSIIEDTDTKSVQAVLSGDATLFSAINKDELLQDLQGIKKSLIAEVMNVYPEIASSQIYMRPPWMFSLPSNPERIHIIEQIDE